MTAFDVTALTLLYLIEQDLDARASYVRSEHLTPSTMYSLFFHTFSITGSTVQFPLVSPPVLDWVQVLVALLILVNGLYIFSVIRTPPEKKAR